MTKKEELRGRLIAAVIALQLQGRALYAEKVTRRWVRWLNKLPINGAWAGL